MIDMSFAAKTIILAGLIITSLGVLLVFYDKIPFLGKLPGDFLIHKNNFTFYFPLTTSIILSIIISLILYFIGKR